ncbi:MAG: type I-C CRISPR-associated protein Cas8c/Csd1 [Rhodospirillaceae bacterium]
MILSALDAYYRRMSAGDDQTMPPYGFALQKVVGAIQLDGEGRFLGLLDLQVKDDKGKARPMGMMTPEPPGRTAGVSSAFLCDNGGYLFGFDLKGKAERAARQFEAAAALHKEVLAGVDHPAARAICRHFETWDIARAADVMAAQDTALLQGWLVFSIIGAYAHDEADLRDAWARYAAAQVSGMRGQCLVTGKDDQPIARLHPGIKGAGGQSSGASLVSFEMKSARSFGKEKGDNAPVGEAAAFNYGAALNHLLRRDVNRSRTIGDMTVVVWAERPNPAEDLLMDLVDPARIDPDDDAPAEDKARASRVRDALDHVIHGTVPLAFQDDVGVRFYLLGLSPNAARLSVRLWQVDTLGVLMSRIREHQRDLSLPTDFPKRPRYPSLWSLVHDARPKDGEGKARGKADNDKLFKLHADLLRAAITGGPYPAAITGGPYPAALLPVLLARFRSDGHITHPRVALIKAVISRRWRIDNTDKRELTMGLDETRTEPGYLLGRLFAALERLQEAALGDNLNRTIRDKFIGAAAATPRGVFNHLLPLSEAHRKKARRDSPGNVVNADKVIGKVMDGISDIPAVLAPDDQALFFIGYYQQRQVFFTKKPAKTETAPDATLIDED